MRLKTLLTTLGLGAGLMYFLDPQHGERRRTMIRDRANRFVNDIDRSVDTAVRDARNRTRGMLTEMTARLSDDAAPDWILEERVRSNLGRLMQNTRDVTVTANEGRIYLSGHVLRGEEEAIVKSALRSRGVHGVENRLQIVDGPQGIPALEGSQEASSSGQTRGNWSPTTRLVSSVGGSLLTLYGLTRKGLAKPVLSTAGLILTTRGMTNLDTRSLLGMGTGENGIRVNKAINIFAPIDEVYQFFRNFENFHLFMSHVQEISTEGEISTWKVSGPAGIPVEFQSRVIQEVPNESISWETLPESQVRHAGFVRFDENRDGSTRVSIQMAYIPPAGALGHAVAQLFGVDPRQAMNEDLVRLKSLLETGKTSTEDTKVEYTGPTNHE